MDRLLTVVRLVQILNEVSENDGKAGDKQLCQFLPTQAACSLPTAGRDPGVGRDGGIRDLHQQIPRQKTAPDAVETILLLCRLCLVSTGRW